MNQRSATENGTPNSLSRLLSGDIKGFDEGLQRLLRGPGGIDLRRSHIRELLALHIFQGDFRRADAAMDTPIPELDYGTPNELAETHEGMLSMREVIARRVNARPKGLGALVDALDLRQGQETSLLLDLLPAAWGLKDAEFELLLQVRPGWLTAWRNGETSVSLPVRRRLRRLFRLQNAFSRAADPLSYSSAWRHVWPADSALGRKSLWEAYEELGDEALEIFESHFPSH